MLMNIDKIYADKWQVSSKFFLDSNYYESMSEILKPYKRVLELGCGVGYSTLSLVNGGHEVIAVEKNHECILKAKSLLEENEGAGVTFIEADIMEECFRNDIISSQKVDVVICWNPGTQLDEESLQHYTPFMIDYGLTVEQIHENPASSYSELMLWYACKTAKAMGVSMHIIDRCGKVDKDITAYYQSLGFKTGFSQCMMGMMEAESISDGGVPLISQGSVMKVQRIPIFFVSVLFI